jgi:hypothetical protein
MAERDWVFSTETNSKFFKLAARASFRMKQPVGTAPDSGLHVHLQSLNSLEVAAIIPQAGLFPGDPNLPVVATFACLTSLTSLFATPRRKCLSVFKGRSIHDSRLRRILVDARPEDVGRTQHLPHTGILGSATPNYHTAR